MDPIETSSRDGLMEGTLDVDGTVDRIIQEAEADIHVKEGGQNMLSLLLASLWVGLVKILAPIIVKHADKRIWNGTGDYHE
tara:strand:- start:493 stop:735 length:243 start_codon:yes stop_codon:yes gene_type:complete